MTESLNFHEKYSLLGEISRGGMGVVYRAMDNQLGREVAIKVMLGEGFDVEALQRFQREAQVLASLKHPNIVPVYDFGWHNNRPYLVMALLSGQSLESLVKQRIKTTGSALELAEALDLLAPIAEALARCHERGIIHRDLKPSNIFIEQDSQRPVLLDFGLVKVSRSQDLALSVQNPLTKTGDLLGTPEFMAPEQMDPKSFTTGVRPETDVWGLAATMFAVLSGRSPAKAESPFQTFQLITTKPLPSVTEFNAEVSTEWVNFLEQCFDKSAWRRPSMEDFTERLRAGPEERSSRGLRVVLVLSVLSLLGVVLGLWAMPGPEVLSFQVPSACRDQRVMVEGQVSGTLLRVSLAVNDKEPRAVPLGEGGRFRVKLRLPEGASTVTLRVRNWKGERSQRAEIERDSKAPQLRLQEEIKERVFEGSLEVSVRLSEAVIVKVFEARQGMAERLLATEELGAGLQSLSLPLPGFGKRTVIIELTDRVGLKSRQRYDVERLKTYVLGPAVPGFEAAGRYSDLKSALAALTDNSRLLISERECTLDFKAVWSARSVLIEGLLRDSRRPRVLVKDYSGFHCNSGQELCVRHLKFVGQASQPIGVEVYIFSAIAVKSFRVESCVFVSAVGKAIHVSGQQSKDVIPVVLKDSKFLAGGDQSVYCGPQTKVFVGNCVFQDQPQDMCFYADSSSHVDLQNCRFSSSYGGVVVSNARSLKMADCQFRNMLGYGFKLAEVGILDVKKVVIDGVNVTRAQKPRAQGASFRGVKSGQVRFFEVSKVYGHALIVSEKSRFEGHGFKVAEWSGTGAAALNLNNASLSLSQCQFLGLGPKGGVTRGLLVGAGELRLTDCRLQDIHGTAILAAKGGRVVLSGVSFKNNKKDRYASQDGQIRGH